MGWQAGCGLGKSNQGRTDNIETQFRRAGLGSKGATKTGPDGENYKDNLKKSMLARYHERD